MKETATYYLFFSTLLLKPCQLSSVPPWGV